MKKYYIGVAVLTVLVLAVLGFAYVSSLSGRNDRQVRVALEQANRDIENYASSNNKLPTSLNQVYTANPPRNITYERLAADIYMLCGTFTNEVVSREGPWAREDRKLTQYAERQKAKQPDVNFVASGSYGFYSLSHKKGKNCYLVQSDSVEVDSPFPSGADIYRFDPNTDSI